MAEPQQSAFSDKYTGQDSATLTAQIRQQKFFHDMNLPEGRTGSWVYEGTLPPNYHLWPAFRYLKELSLDGKRCLDIGTFDGMTAFVLAELGAAQVDATCQFDLDRFRLVRALRRYANVAYFPKTSLQDIATTFESSTYDLVVISAMLHHLTSPLDALLQVRRLLKRDGVFVFESIFIDQDEPALLLNTELSDPVFGSPTLFVPTLGALRGMLRLASLDIVSETRLLGGAAARERNYERVTFLAHAKQPSRVKGRTAKAIEIHEKTPTFGSIDFSQLETGPEAKSNISYSGPPGPRLLNIWTDPVDAPLQPATTALPPNVRTSFAPGSENQFLSLASDIPDGSFTWDDIYLLGARYPAETMPDGMSWSIKQLGNLFILDYVRKLGLSRVLEVGPGFNFYFMNHLPAWCQYAALDSKGFYDNNILGLANAARNRASVSTTDGLLGKTHGILKDNDFDACISVSVLEHVAASDIADVAKDMYRILKPGGWALHSIDILFSTFEQDGRAWLDALLAAGFRIDTHTIDKSLGGDAPTIAAGDLIFAEPLSIRTRFAEGYKKSIWGMRQFPRSRAAMGTYLVAAQKPPQTEGISSQQAKG